MLNALSGCVECANDDIMNAMMIPGCMMGPMYGVMANNRNWLGEICNLHQMQVSLCDVSSTDK